jgi:dihydroxy-acid dehydratase
MLPYEEGENTFVTSDLKEAIGKRAGGAIDQPTFERWRTRMCNSGGVCSMYGTANTMGAFLEAAGVAPFGSSTMLFCEAGKQRQARDAASALWSWCGKTFGLKTSLPRGPSTTPSKPPPPRAAPPIW